MTQQKLKFKSIDMNYEFELRNSIQYLENNKNKVTTLNSKLYTVNHWEI